VCSGAHRPRDLSGDFPASHFVGLGATVSCYPGLPGSEYKKCNGHHVRHPGKPGSPGSVVGQLISTSSAFLARPGPSRPYMDTDCRLRLLALRILSISPSLGGRVSTSTTPRSKRGMPSEDLVGLRGSPSRTKASGQARRKGPAGVVVRAPHDQRDLSARSGDATTGGRAPCSPALLRFNAALPCQHCYGSVWAGWMDDSPGFRHALTRHP